MKKFDTRALYIWTDSPDQHAFWKDCGINMLQFSDIGWHKNANTILPDYYKSIAEQIHNCKQDGFEVNMILFSNIKQWRGPEDMEPSGIGEKFYPRNKKEMTDRLDCLRYAVKMFNEADGFTFFAGDPGGVPSDLGEATLNDWIEMGRLVGEVVSEIAPHAYFNLNPWAITMWQYPDLSCGDVNWWIRENELTKQLINVNKFINEKTGIELPCHNYYRAMSLRLYSEAGLTPDLVPLKSDTNSLYDRGIKRVWAWPYFILDEADDGDIGPDGSLREMTQSETRYIHRFINQARELGFNGIVGNWSYLGHKAKALNTYAFGRFTADPDATPQQVIKEYSENIACGESAIILSDIFKYIENNSNWQKKLPDSLKIQNYETGIINAEDAIVQLNKVQLLEKPKHFNLAESTEDLYEKLFTRLNLIIENERKQ